MNVATPPFSGQPLRTNVYVDGFNLYYGSLKRRPNCKWLNIRALSLRMLRPGNALGTVKLFTARVKPRPNDPDQPKRQALYFRAFRTEPNSEIVFGRYTEHPRTLPLEHPPLFDKNGHRLNFVSVVQSNEKGSDVNLATHLLIDGFLNNYDAAVVISNDSDLAEPIKLVQSTLKKPVGIWCPYPHKSAELNVVAAFHDVIAESDLMSCQFPDDLADARGFFSKPASWS